MTSSIRDRTAIVGVGTTPFYKRGESAPQTRIELAGKAIITALADAGLRVSDVDGFAFYSSPVDAAELAQVLGVRELRYTASVTGGGGGSAGSVALAASAVAAGLAEVVVCSVSLRQTEASRFGRVFGAGVAAGGRAKPRSRSAGLDFVAPYGLIGPGNGFALLAARHMWEYGTTREHFAEVAISTRANAVRRETARFRAPLTRDEYFSAPMLSDPLCLYDFCMESEGAAACVVTSAERARDLQRRPVYVNSCAIGGNGNWGQAITWLNMPAEDFASSGMRQVARRLFAGSDVDVSEIDVALLYDHFTPMVLMQLEDFGFCGIGEGGAFVEEGNIRWPEGQLPVNTHGGNLSEAYMLGMTHVIEAVEQLRGTAVNQVPGAEHALVTGGPGGIPLSALILRRG